MITGLYASCMQSQIKIKKMKKLNHDTVLNFGKHKGKTVQQVLDTEPSYMVWVMNNTEWEMSKKLFDDVCEYESIEQEKMNDTHLDIWDVIDRD